MNKIKNIRSFVKRQRKFTPNKQKMFDEAWEIYGRNVTAGMINFYGDVPLVLEIGFGMGATLFDSAKNNPTQNFIGIEVYRAGIAALFDQLTKEPLNNICVYNEDAVIVLQQCIPDNSLDKVLIFFPDPWPKKRHHKRRLIQPNFIALLQRKLKPKGILHIATDWEDYAKYIIVVLKNNPAFMMLEAFLASRLPTKFEQRGKKQGHKIFDLLFVMKC